MPRTESPIPALNPDTGRWIASHILDMADDGYSDQEAIQAADRWFNGDRSVWVTLVRKARTFDCVPNRIRLY